MLRLFQKSPSPRKFSVDKQSKIRYRDFLSFRYGGSRNDRLVVSMRLNDRIGIAGVIEATHFFVNTPSLEAIACPNKHDLLQYAFRRLKV